MNRKSAFRIPQSEGAAMIVDINGYVGNWPFWPIRNRTGDDLVRLMDRYGIDRVAVCSLRGIFDHWERGNEEVLDLVRTYRDRVIGFATVTPVFGEAALEMLPRYREEGVRGLRLFPYYHGYALAEDLMLDRILKRASELGMTVVIPKRLTMNWMLATLDIRPVAAIATRFPELKIVVGGVNYNGARETVGMMKTHGNVLIETSCLQYMGSIEMLVREVGTERILFGAGLPLQYPACGLAKIANAEIPEKDRERILGGNAARLLGL